MTEKIGIEISGVLDSFSHYVELSRFWVAMGYEVHIITKLPYSQTTLDKINDLGVHYTNFHSLNEKSNSFNKSLSTYNNQGIIKSNYCTKKSIKYLYDSNPYHAKFFKRKLTTFILVGSHV